MAHNGTITEQQARDETVRCLSCFDAPCTQACPAHIDIPKFIAMMRQDNIRGAAEVVRSANAMANVCGAVCPEEVFCQSVCNRASIDSPINIRELHAFVTHRELDLGQSRLARFPGSGKRVAVVGGGPTGLSCAFELAKMGHAVTLFDGEGPGGIPRRSIPTFRLTEKTVSADVGFLIANFKTVRKNVRAKDLQSTKRKFDAVFLASGLGNDRPLSTKGEKLDGVIPVLQFLQGAKKGNGPRLTRKRVVVVGGGNVSLDAAAMAKRLGASTVTLIYRRGEKEMKVWKSELQEAIKQGVEFRFLTSPAEIVGKKKVSGIVCRRTKLSTKKDSSGRPIPVEVKGSEHVIAADLVIIAIGQEIAPGLFDTLERTPRGYIKVDKEFRTSEPGIFAGGDMVSGEGTIVQSVAHGKSAANAIHGYISSQR